MIFQGLQAKYCSDSEIIDCCCALRGHQFLTVVQVTKKRHYFLRCCKRSKEVFAQAQRALRTKYQNSFKYTVVKIDMNVLRIERLIYQQQILFCALEIT